MGDLKLAFTVTYDVPFQRKTSSMITDIELINVPESVSGIRCTKLQLLSDKELLGEATLDQTLSGNGDSFKSSLKPSFTMRDVEEKKNTVNVKLTCSYDKQGGTSTQSLIQSGSLTLGTVTFINPDVS